MAIIAADLAFYLTGGAGNTLPALSLGGVISNTAFTDNILQNLFANISPAEALAGSVKYRALSFKNLAAETAYATVIYLSQETTSADTTVAIAYDATGTQNVVDEDTAPIDLTFSTPLSLVAGIALGDIAASGVARVWFKRTVSPEAAAVSDSGKFTVVVGSAP